MSRKGQKQSELTPRQALVVLCYANPQSKTFGNKASSYLAAGYRQTKSYVQAACNLFSLPKIKQAVNLYRSKIEMKLEQTNEITKEYALAQLQKVHNSCYDENEKCIDRTNAIAAVRLMMQKNSLLTDKHSIEHVFPGYTPPSEEAVARSKRRESEYLASQPTNRLQANPQPDTGIVIETENFSSQPILATGEGGTGAGA